MDASDVLLECRYALTITLSSWVQQTGGKGSCAVPIVRRRQSYLAPASFETRVVLLQTADMHTWSEKHVQSDCV